MNHPPHYPHFDAARVSSVLLPMAAFALGFALMFTRTSLEISPSFAGYLSLAVLAGIDSVLGGVRAGIQGTFQSDIFLSGFLVNTVAAVALAVFGDALGIPDVYLAAVLVFGWRMLGNISTIRRFFVERARAGRAAIEAALAADRVPETHPGADVVGT